MTDREIERSRVDHWFNKADALSVVRAGTPSRLGVYRITDKARVLWDEAEDHWIKVARDRR